MAAIDEIKAIKATRKDLRNFGITLAVALLLFSAYFFWKGVSAYRYLVPIAALLAVGGRLFPFALRPLYRLWRTVTIIVGLLITTIFLGLLFYLVVTPIGLARRVFGRKTVVLGWEEQAPTYWNRRDRQSSEESHLKQY